jgi:hypothetical protein
MVGSRFCSVFSVIGVALGVVACGSTGGGAGETVGKTAAAQLGSPGVPDAADTSCNIDLRDVGIGSDGVAGDLDISSEALLEGDVPYVLYQSGSDPTWYSADALPATGAGTGYQRYQFTLTQIAPSPDAGDAYPTIQLIPYLITTAGTHLFDHNVSADQNYVLDAANQWSIHYDGDYCVEPSPPGTATVVFNTGWTETTYGTFVQGGKLDVSYALARLPQCEGETTDGVEAWATTAYAYFLPGGETLSGAVNGSFDAAAGTWMSLLFERNIPTNATSVQLWFETSGDGCQTSWDSDYGQNYRYSVTPAAP